MHEKAKFQHAPKHSWELRLVRPKKAFASNPIGVLRSG